MSLHVSNYYFLHADTDLLKPAHIHMYMYMIHNYIILTNDDHSHR